MVENILHTDTFITLLCNGSHSIYLDQIAWMATKTITWLPLAGMLLYVILRQHNLKGIFAMIIALALCVLIADQIASSIFKPLVARYRPTNDPSIMYLIDTVKGYRGGSYGFFSSHAANTMALATFISLTFRYRPLTYWLYAWALLNCWTRIYLGVHYLGDLTVGTLCGIAVGALVYYVFTQWQKHTKYTMAPDCTTGHTPSGYSIAYAQWFTAGIALTFFAITLGAFF